MVDWEAEGKVMPDFAKLEGKKGKGAQQEGDLPLWAARQHKVFTNWINNKVSSANENARGCGMDWGPAGASGTPGTAMPFRSLVEPGFDPCSVHDADVVSRDAAVVSTSSLRTRLSFLFSSTVDGIEEPLCFGL